MPTRQTKSRISVPPEQVPLPLDERESAPPETASRSTSRIEGGRRGPGRPRVWTSEAERKRAYRERLAADFAEPDRLRRELRSEQKKVARRDHEIVRLKHELARSDAGIRAAEDRQAELAARIETLEAKVEDWRSRARTLAKKREAEHTAGDAIGQRRPARSSRKPLELPNLGTRGLPPKVPGDPRL